MNKSLSYADAVKLLGSEDSRLVKAIDLLTGGILLVATAAGAGWALSLFEAQSKFIELSNELIKSTRRHLKKCRRINRTEKISAAHSIIVVSAYFEAVDQISHELLQRPPAPRITGSFFIGDTSDAELNAEAYKLLKKAHAKVGQAEQIKLATGTSPLSTDLQSIARELLHAELPLPSPQQPYEVMLEEMFKFYNKMTDDIPQLLLGDRLWKSTSADVLRTFRSLLVTEIPILAVKIYQELFRQLAVDFPEIGFWANLIDHQMTRSEVLRVQTALADLERMLESIASGRLPDKRREALHRFYRSALDRPIAETGEVPAEGLQIPLLGRAYINPDFRVANVGRGDQIHVESWWDKHVPRSDIQGFLLGYLTYAQATTRPLVVLGHPGSGKSVLTKVLSASLPASEFLAVRVVLREVDTDADIQEQIEYGITAATGEKLTWPDLLRTAGDALPVVLFDGFDELLQATGISKSAYLERLAEFQQRERILGRPMVAVVTSRIAVADRVRVPAEGLTCILLEPFSVDKVERWLLEWNDANRSYLELQSLRPLTVDTVCAYPALSAQPLLLLMLALYDADDNTLQNFDDQLGQSELYERLLRTFAEREVAKVSVNLDDESFARKVDSEMFGLSLTAFAMFNRGRQWATESELDQDLGILSRNGFGGGEDGSFRSPRTAAQYVISRFFFIYRAQASRGTTRLTAFEFLHATFGEFLVARLVAFELRDLAFALRANRMRYTAPDDGFLYAILSFAPLASRATTIEFLSELVRGMELSGDRSLRNLLITLFHSVFDTRTSSNFERYEPMNFSIPTRLSIYSANLLLLTIIVGDSVTASDLFPGAEDLADSWRRCALLWRSQLPREGWSWLASSLNLRRTVNSGRPDLMLTLASTRGQISRISTDSAWKYGEITTQRPVDEAWRGPEFGTVVRERLFACDPDDDAIIHALQPIEDLLGVTLTTFVRLSDDRCVSVAHSLIRLWVASCVTRGKDDELGLAYDDCMEIAISGLGAFDSLAEGLYRDIVIYQLSYDAKRLSSKWRDRARARLRAARDAGYGDFAERVLSKLGSAIA